MNPALSRLVTGLLFLLPVIGCKTAPPKSTPSEATANARTIKNCVAIRGNGELIWAHFAGLARLLESEGTISGVAGGSSASISSFLFESVMANKELTHCGATTCTDKVVAQRAAFLMKSLYFWLDIIKDSPEGEALAHIRTLKARLNTFDSSRLGSTDLVVVKNALVALQTLLESDSVRAIVNQDFLKFIFDGELLADPRRAPILLFRAREAKKAVEQFGAFDASSPQIFFRPGIIDFQAIGRLIGNLGDFYAGYAPGMAESWQNLFASCTEAAVGRLPWELEGTECVERFRATVTAFRSGAKSVIRHRIDEPVGRHIQVAVTTATLVKGQDRFQMMEQTYRDGGEVALNFTADDFSFGYAAPRAWFDRAMVGLRALPDLRSKKALYLGELPWSEMLAVSPAEPGLASAQKFPTLAQYISFGGWSDLAPVNVLAESGCEQTIYLTRRGPDSKFARGIASQLGFAGDLEALFSTDAPNSSLHLAINRADKILCTDWDRFDGFSLTGIKQLFTDAYRTASLLSRGDRRNAPTGCH